MAVIRQLTTGHRPPTTAFQRDLRHSHHTRALPIPPSLQAQTGAPNRSLLSRRTWCAIIEMSAWAHIDIAGKALGMSNASYLDQNLASGFGVRLLTHWLMGRAAKS